MARQKKSGSDSILLLGIATDLDTPITQWDSPADENGKFFPVRFPLTGLTIGEQSDRTESNTIIGGRRAVPSQRGQLWAAGDYPFEVLPGTIRYIIKMLTNPAVNPTGVDYSGYSNKSKEIKGAVAAGDNSFMVNNPNSPPAQIPTRLDPPSRIAIEGSGTGKMVVTGKRRIGKPQEEEFDFTETVDVTSGNRSTNQLFLIYIQCEHSECTGYRYPRLKRCE